MEPLTTLFLSLFAAHLLADFVLQSDRDIALKNHGPVFAKHIGIVTFLSWGLAGDWTNWWIPAGIGITHALLDRGKLAGLRRGWNGTRLFVWDQAGHLAVIAGLTWLAARLGDYTHAFQAYFGDYYPTILVLIVGLVITVQVGGLVIGVASAAFLDQIQEERNSLEHGEKTEDLREGLRKGGKIIGQLERALIFFFVLVGKPEAVAFLVAAKSIFRFGELTRHSRKEAEYILIGTLMSFGWGLVVAWLTRYMIDLIW